MSLHQSNLPGQGLVFPRGLSCFCCKVHDNPEVPVISDSHQRLRSNKCLVVGVDGIHRFNDNVIRVGYSLPSF